MAPQLRVYVPPHPIIRHWLTIVREKHTPVPLFRAAMSELGKWLTYEAIRECLPVQEVDIETPIGSASGQLIDASIPLAIVPILRAGLAMLEGCQTLLPTANVYHLGLVRNEETLEASCYLNRLPERFEPETRIFIVEPMMATGGSIITTHRERG
jgi:uracil phosphoribosyltransferase